MPAVQSSKGSTTAVLEALRSLTTALPAPGNGSTMQLWEFFATAAAHDLVAARVLEPHFDAAAILQQAGIQWEGGTAWGVFAAEGAGFRLGAVEEAGQWRLNGIKPWCSLAGELTHAIVSAHVPGGRRIFAVDLKQPGIQVSQTGWVSRGLKAIPSVPVHFNSVPAQAVGGLDWYLNRPGFAVGGVGVAACWFGGAVGLFRHLHHSALQREPDQLALAWLGEADTLLSSGAAVLAQAAEDADTQKLGPRRAAEVRGHIAELCERMLQLSGHATGPGPLSLDEEHAQRAADLNIYLRQHHAARDEAALGRMLLQDSEVSPW